MTSKQAFNIVRCGGLGCTEKEFYNAESIVENDLDMLEFLKKKMSEDTNYIHRTEVKIRIGFDSVEEYERFERWLNGIHKNEN